MKIKSALILIAAFMVVALIPAVAGKKKGPQRGTLEKMEAVPCGAKQRGITGLGSVFASAGIEHVNSDEKLCQQYLLRTDDMEYHIRPADNKHPAILTVGQEGEFKIDKDRLYLKMPDGDRKTHAYEVVSMEPNGTQAESKESVRPER
jgi:hypothetical protein